MTNYGSATERKITEVVTACRRHGSRSIVALAGVPGTGKSFVASIAAQRLTDEPLMVREVQFHQSFSYEEFIEGLRIDETSGVKVVPGVFQDWNEQALEDERNKYVLLVEELTRANLPAVLGELMTYLEHRDRAFMTLYSRKPVRVAENLVLLATYNPTDRTALDLDAALIRRLRIIRFRPSVEQLVEMLHGRSLSKGVIERLKNLFYECERIFPEEYEHLMPFGHGVFSDVKTERPDLYDLWIERISHLLRRPQFEPHPFTEVIEEAYPWRDRTFSVDDEET